MCGRGKRETGRKIRERRKVERCVGGEGEERDR